MLKFLNYTILYSSVNTVFINVLQVQVYFSKKAKSQVHRFPYQLHLFHLNTASGRLRPCSIPSALITHPTALFHLLATQTSLAARGENCWTRLPQKCTTNHLQVPKNSKNRRRRSIFQDFNQDRISHLIFVFSYQSKVVLLCYLCSVKILQPKLWKLKKN